MFWRAFSLLPANVRMPVHIGRGPSSFFARGVYTTAVCVSVFLFCVSSGDERGFAEYGLDDGGVYLLRVCTHLTVARSRKPAEFAQSALIAGVGFWLSPSRTKKSCYTTAQANWKENKQQALTASVCACCSLLELVEAC